MNARTGDTHLHGSVGVVSNGEAPITIQMPCPGPKACPYRLPPEGEPDAKEENEFFRDTGIRAGTHARRLLRELKGRHEYLKWRGSGSLSRMWKSNTLQYLDGDQKLRFNLSRLAEGYGWSIFLFGVGMEILLVLLLTSRPKVQDLAMFGAAITFLFGGLASMWFGAETLISPERAGRHLNKLEMGLQEGGPGRP